MSTPERTTMNAKPVFFRPAKTVLNLESKFEEKLLCDGPTFSLGDACAYSCTFCYVPDMMRKAAYVPKDYPHEEMVVRRANALTILIKQLNGIKPEVKDKPLVIFSSPLVDVAANMDLVAETVAACILILEKTQWHIRLLSKSSLLPVIARRLIRAANDRKTFSVEDTVRRMIYGVSTGTLDDKLAAAFEQGCPKISKRLESLHWLQDEGYRTYGMICPSLPQTDYPDFAYQMAWAISAKSCEHVWAEVINVRGESMIRTCKALHDAGYEAAAKKVEEVSQSKQAWEDYARQTYQAHAELYKQGGAVGCRADGSPRLRYLHYPTPQTLSWWSQHQNAGAILLGAAAGHA